MSDLVDAVDNGPRMGTIVIGTNSPDDKQIWIDRHSKINWNPEQELMAAILVEGIEDALYPDSMCQRKYKTMGNRHMNRRQARFWIADDSAEYIFSFRNCTEHLGLDTAAVRKRIQAQYERKGVKPCQYLKAVPA